MVFVEGIPNEVRCYAFVDSTCEPSNIVLIVVFDVLDSGASTIEYGLRATLVRLQLKDYLL